MMHARQACTIYNLQCRTMGWSRFSYPFTTYHLGCRLAAPNHSSLNLNASGGANLFFVFNYSG